MKEFLGSMLIIIVLFLVYALDEYKQNELKGRCDSMPVECECKLMYRGKYSTPYIQYKNKEGRYITED